MKDDQKQKDIVTPTKPVSVNKNDTTVQTNNNNRKNFVSKNHKNFPEKIYSEKVITINRVTKVTKGGRQFKFSAIVVIGDKKGKVGLGTGKANEVPDAIKKAIKSAEKSLVNIPIVGTTIPHEVLGKYSGGKVLIKPAKAGKGIIAGGPIRLMMELAGVKDIYSKSLGSNTPINMIRATLDGLQQLKTADEFLFLRDKLPVATNIEIVKE